MEETEKESRFTNCDIFAYVKDGKYPADYTKDEKRALRKWAKFLEPSFLLHCTIMLVDVS